MPVCPGNLELLRSGTVGPLVAIFALELASGSSDLSLILASFDALILNCSSVGASEIGGKAVSLPTTASVCWASPRRVEEARRGSAAVLVSACSALTGCSFTCEAIVSGCSSTTVVREPCCSFSSCIVAACTTEGLLSTGLSPNPSIPCTELVDRLWMMGTACAFK